MAATIETGMQAAPRAMDDTRDMVDVGAVVDAELAVQMREFMREVAGTLKSLRQGYETAREEQEFTDRQDVNQRRMSLTLAQQVDAHGNAVKTYKDGHAEMGITHGWSLQAAKTATAYLRRGLLEESKRPYMVTGRGSRAENKTVEKMVYGVLDDLMRRGEFRSRFARVCNLMPRRGTAILRYLLEQRTRWTMGEDGELHETVEAIYPKIQVWPLEHVYVSNPDQPEAADQEGVFWLTPKKTLAQLEEDEIVLQEGRESEGRFRNLEQVRRVVEEYQTRQMDTTSASVFPTATLVEYEGALPILGWVKRGLLTWRVAKFFGVDVGEDPDPSNEEAVRAWGRRLGRIAHWRVSTLMDWSGAVSLRDAGQTGEIVLEFAPMRAARNSLYRFGWIQEELRFYMQGVVDLGRRLEDAGDCLRNGDMWAQYYNAHPGKMVDETALVDATQENLDALLNTPDKVLAGRPGRDVRQAVQFFQLPQDVNVEMKIQQLKREFEFLTGVSAAAKGSDTAQGTGTLGEIQINENKSTLEIHNSILDNGSEICRLAKDMLEDVVEALKAPESSGETAGTNPGQALLGRYRPFVEYASRVSGLAPSEIEEALPTLENLSEEIEFRHPMAAGNDRAALVQMLTTLYQVTGGMGFPDAQSFVRACLEIGGFNRAEDVTQRHEGMDPGDEERLLSQGTWVAPDPREDLLAHLMSHAGALSELQRRIASGQPRPEDPVYELQLQQHIGKTVELVRVQVQLAQALGGGQGGAAPGTPGNLNPNPAAGQMGSGSFGGASRATWKPAGGERAAPAKTEKSAPGPAAKDGTYGTNGTYGRGEKGGKVRSVGR